VLELTCTPICFINDRRGAGNPDELLTALKHHEQPNGAALKIFFGASRRVGKPTHARVSAAARTSGIDLVIGYVEPHGRLETGASVTGLEQCLLLEVDIGDCAQ